MTFRASVSPVAIILYLLLVAAWLMALHYFDSLLLLAGFAPFYGLAMVSLVKKQKYVLHDDTVEVNGSFSSYNIVYSNIRSVAITKNPWWKRLFAGIPSRSVKVEYRDKQASALHAREAEKLAQELGKKTAKNKTGIREGVVE